MCYKCNKYFCANKLIQMYCTFVKSTIVNFTIFSRIEILSVKAPQEAEYHLKFGLNN